MGKKNQTKQRKTHQTQKKTTTSWDKITRTEKRKREKNNEQAKLITKQCH